MVEEKGKCYSMIDQGQRVAFDAYQTPYSLTWTYYDQYLKDKLNPGMDILEPCFGGGAIATALLQKNENLTIVGKDIQTGQNFYEEEERYHVIITNPPYKNTERFIEKCKQVTDEFFLLLPITHLQGQKRYNNKTYQGLKFIHIFSRMPFFEKEIRVDGKFKTGMQAVGWFHFDMRNVAEHPMIDWIDISEYILKKNEESSE